MTLSYVFIRLSRRISDRRWLRCQSKEVGKQTRVAENIISGALLFIFALSGSRFENQTYPTKSRLMKLIFKPESSEFYRNTSSQTCVPNLPG